MLLQFKPDQKHACSHYVELVPNLDTSRCVYRYSVIMNSWTRLITWTIHEWTIIGTSQDHQYKNKNIYQEMSAFAFLLKSKKTQISRMAADESDNIFHDFLKQSLHSNGIPFLRNDASIPLAWSSEWAVLASCPNLRWYPPQIVYARGKHTSRSVHFVKRLSRQWALIPFWIRGTWPYGKQMYGKRLTKCTVVFMQLLIDSQMVLIAMGASKITTSSTSHMILSSR